MTFLMIGTAADGGCKDLELRSGLRLIGGCGWEQVLGIDEPPAGLPETFGRLLLAEAEHVDALFADAGGKPCEITVGRNQAEAVETAAMEEVHRVDDEGDIGGVLPRGVGELLLGDDGVLGQEIGPCLRAGAGEVAIDAPDAGLADLGDLLEQTVRDLRRGVVGIDQNGKARRAWFSRHERLSVWKNAACALE